MAHATAYLPLPEFCLGGTIYPVDYDFDWSHDKDVLLEAVRDTHVAMRMHHFATLTPDRDWLRCECTDVAAHRDLLLAGHAALVDTVLTLSPEAPRKSAWRMPLNAQWLRMVNGFVTLILPMTVAACTILPE